MKKTVFRLSVLFLLFVGFTNCSSDDEDSNSTNDSFTFIYEGETVSISSWEGVKVDNALAIVGRSDDGINIAIEFNKYGNLGYAAVYSTQDVDFEHSESFNYFKSNYFNFNLVNLDESNNRVSVNFSGDLYENEYDITSTTHPVEGSFNISYTDVDPIIEGIGLSAKVDGVDWHHSDSDQNGGFFSGSNVSLNNFNDGAFTFSIEVNHDNSDLGSYNFNESSTVNRIKLYEYDPATNESIVYETVGTFVLTEKSVGVQQTVISGNFSFIATNPTDNSTVTITNGTYKEIYNNY